MVLAFYWRAGSWKNFFKFIGISWVSLVGKLSVGLFKRKQTGYFS